MVKLGKFWFPDNEKHFQTQFQYGEYQLMQRKASLSHCTDFRVCLDIGAHVGTWSQDLQYYFQQTYAFEPMEEHFKCLKANVDRDRVHPYNVGLGSKREEVQLAYNDPTNTGTTSVSDHGETIRIVTLDDFNFENVDYMKIDVEGYELEVLKGGAEFFTKNKPVINIEINSNSNRFGYGKAEIDNYLSKFGIHWVDRVNNDYIYK